jgi:hypothetical protein
LSAGEKKAMDALRRGCALSKSGIELRLELLRQPLAGLLDARGVETVEKSCGASATLLCRKRKRPAELAAKIGCEKKKVTKVTTIP